MYNIIKSQMYQALRENGTYYTFIAGIGLFFLSLIMNEYDLSSITGSEIFADGTVSVIVFMIIMIFTSRICGGDILDKTINYEMLTGIPRGKTYFGRFSVSMIFSTLIFLIISVLPILIITRMNGWGNIMPTEEAAKRMLLSYIVLVRFVCLMTLLNFTMMNMFSAILSGFIIILIESLLSLVIEELSLPEKIMAPFFTVLSIDFINKYNYTYDYIGGEDIEIVKDMFSMGNTVLYAISPLVFGAVFLTAGYLLFRKKDMN